MERFKSIVGILLAVGIIFGSFTGFTGDIPTFGFAWFTNLLWFAIGFPVLVGIGLIIFTLLVTGEHELKMKATKAETESP